MSHPTSSDRPERRKRKLPAPKIHEDTRHLDLPESLGVPTALAQFLAANQKDLTADEIQAIGSGASSDVDIRVKRTLVANWQQGRDLAVIQAVERAREEVKISRSQITQELSFTKQAVSDWFQGKKGIESGNLELLVRYAQSLCPSMVLPSSHRQDLSGYMRCVSQLGAEMSEQLEFDGVTEYEFWLLWFTHRSTLWLKALHDSSDRLRRLAIDEIESNAHNAMMLSSGNGPEHDGSQVADLIELINKWGKSYLVTIRYLHPLCWTAPNAQ